MHLGDAKAIFLGYAQDAAVTRYLTWRPHTSVEQTQTFLKACVGQTTSRTYGLVMRASTEVIGVFDVRYAGATKLEFGYAIGRPFWGAGLMTEALTEVVEWALRQPSVWRIGAVADVDNVGSMRVMEKAGLTKEGTLRRWLVHPNVSDAPRDCVSFARTR